MESWFLMGQGRSDGAEQLGGRSLTDLRDHNQAAVLDCLVTATQPVTIRRLQELTGLTRPTVSAAMNSLLEQGDALEQESMHAGGQGRASLPDVYAERHEESSGRGGHPIAGRRARPG